MRKNIYLLIAVFLVSCGTQNQNYSSYQNRNLRKFSNNKANITTRNFPESVAQLRTKFKIKDGGELFLFFTTNASNKKIVIVTKQ